MKYVAKLQIRVLSVYLVGTLDTQIQWRRAIWCIRDADAVIVAYLSCLSVAGIRAVLSLASERNQVILGED